jgi:hypothetical protein
MSMILENQAKQLVTEISADGGALLQQVVTSFSAQAGAGAQWAGIALPLVRKGIWSNRCSRIRFCTANELTFRSSILLRFPVRFN